MKKFKQKGDTGQSISDKNKKKTKHIITHDHDRVSRVPFPRRIGKSRRPAAHGVATMEEKTKRSNVTRLFFSLDENEPLFLNKPPYGVDITIIVQSFDYADSR